MVEADTSWAEQVVVHFGIRHKPMRSSKRWAVIGTPRPSNTLSMQQRCEWCFRELVAKQVGRTGDARFVRSCQPLVANDGSSCFAPHRRRLSRTSPFGNPADCAGTTTAERTSTTVCSGQLLVSAHGRRLTCVRTRHHIGLRSRAGHRWHRRSTWVGVSALAMPRRQNNQVLHMEEVLGSPRCCLRPC